MTLRILRLGLVVGGGALFVFLLLRIGPAAIASSFAHLSWRLGIILVFPFVFITAFDTLGWRFAFLRDSVPFTALLTTRLAGEAFNATTPTASVGGEAVKAWLLRREVPLAESLPSIIVAKTTITIAQGLFLALGIVCAWPTLEPGSGLLTAMVLMLGIEIIGIGGFVLVQMAGLLRGGGRILGRLGLLGDGGARGVNRVDGALSQFYRREPRRLVLSIAAHFVGWCLSAFETYLILKFLNVPVSLLTAIVIEAAGTAIRFVSFMIPAHLGALEGGQVMTFIGLGLPAAAGMSFVLVRRVREAAWVGLGFAVLAGQRSALPSIAPRIAEG
jgi:glycosyltransferase 2 family protein